MTLSVTLQWSYLLKAYMYVYMAGYDSMICLMHNAHVCVVLLKLNPNVPVSDSL